MFGGMVGCAGCGNLVAESEMTDDRCTSCHARATVSSEFTAGHIDEIIPGLYLGDITAATDKAILQKFGISHLVDASGHNYVRLDTILYKEVHVVDCEGADIAQYFEEVNAFIAAARADPAAKVLVHCYRGVSRSATLVLAYLFSSDNLQMTMAELLDFLRTKRAVVDPNRDFWRQLLRYANEAL